MAFTASRPAPAAIASLDATSAFVANAGKVRRIFAALIANATLTAIATARAGTTAETVLYAPYEDRTLYAKEGVMIVDGSPVSKQPNEVLDYDIDCSEWLAPGDYLDILTPAVVSVTPTGSVGNLTVSSSSMTTTVLKLWLTSGVAGTKYKVQARVSTTGGRVKEFEMYVKVKEL